jgi:hypothetical protein
MAELRSKITDQSNRPSDASGIGDTGHTIQIERFDSRITIVRVTYPDGRRKKDIYNLRIVCSCVVLIPILALIFFHRSAVGWWIVIVSFVVAIYFAANTLRQFFAITRSYTFHADGTGLTIDVVYGRQQTSQHFTCAQIVDISVGFSIYQGPNSLFFCWLAIATPFSSEIRCLQNLGGDHLARIAGVLRAAVGLPARTWP